MVGKLSGDPGPWGTNLIEAVRDQIATLLEGHCPRCLGRLTPVREAGGIFAQTLNARCDRCGVDYIGTRFLDEDPNPVQFLIVDDGKQHISLHIVAAASAPPQVP